MALRNRYLAVASMTALTLLALTHAARAEPELEQIGTAPEVTEFGDWSVACDNTKSCEAISTSVARAAMLHGEWGEAAMLHIRVQRAAGPQARPRIFIDRRVWGEMPRPSGPAPSLHVLYPDQNDRTGKAYRLLPLRGGLHELDPRDVDGFLAESRGSAVAATRIAGSADLHGLASTSGMVAALRYIDEAQGRRGTVSAIYAKGARPASTVPPPKALPQVRPVKGLGRFEPLQSPAPAALLEGSALSCPNGSEASAALRLRLANGDVLTKVQCPAAEQGKPLANPVTIWLVTKPGGQQLFASLPRSEQGRSALPAALPNSTFDPRTGLLTAQRNYGQHGDCGWQRQWAWTGREWVLVSSRELHACMGVLPDGWLTIWRSHILQ